MLETKFLIDLRFNVPKFRVVVQISMVKCGILRYIESKIKFSFCANYFLFQSYAKKCSKLIFSFFFQGYNINYL